MLCDIEISKGASETINMSDNNVDTTPAYDKTIIGAVPSGYAAALYAAMRRAKVALVE